MDLGVLTVTIQGDNSPLESSLKDSTNSIDKAMGQIAGAVGLGTAAFGGLNLAIQGIKFNAMMETAQTSFGIMLGSMDKAKEKLAELKNLADHSPLTFAGVTASTSTLLQFGIAGNSVISTVKMLGDVAGGNEERMKSLALVYGQVSSAGRLQGQDLMQLVNAGYNPLMTISQKTGESMADLRKRMEAGGISASEVTDAFKTATSAGGQFFGMMDANAKTLTGSFSTLSDATNTFLGRMTESFNGPILVGVQTLTGVLNIIPGQLGAIAVTVVTVTAGVGALALAVGALTPAFAALGVTINIALLPLLGITATVAAVGAAVFVVANEVDKANKNEFDTARKLWGDIYKSIGSSSMTLDEFIKKAQKVDDIFLLNVKNGLSFQDALQKTAQSMGLSVDNAAKILSSSDKITASQRELSKEWLNTHKNIDLGTAKMGEFHAEIKAMADAQAKNDQSYTVLRAKMISDLQIQDALNVAGIATDKDWLTSKIEIRQRIIDSIEKEAMVSGGLNEKQVEAIRDQVQKIDEYNKSLVKIQEAEAQRIANGEILEAQALRQGGYYEAYAKYAEQRATQEQIVNGYRDAALANQNMAIGLEQDYVAIKETETTGEQIAAGYRAQALRNDYDRAAMERDYIQSLKDELATRMNLAHAADLAAGATQVLAAAIARVGDSSGNLAKVVSALNAMGTALTDVGRLLASGGSDIGAWVSLSVTAINTVGDTVLGWMGIETEAHRKMREAQAAADLARHTADALALQQLMAKYYNAHQTKLQQIQSEGDAEEIKARALGASVAEIGRIRAYWHDEYMAEAKAEFDAQEAANKKAYEDAVSASKAREDSLTSLMGKFATLHKTRLQQITEEEIADIASATSLRATAAQLNQIRTYYAQMRLEEIQNEADAQAAADKAKADAFSSFMKSYTDASKTKVQLLHEELDVELNKARALGASLTQLTLIAQSYHDREIAMLAAESTAAQTAYDQRAKSLDDLMDKVLASQKTKIQLITEEEDASLASATALGASAAQLEAIRTEYTRRRTEELRIEGQAATDASDAIIAANKAQEAQNASDLNALLNRTTLVQKTQEQQLREQKNIDIQKATELHASQAQLLQIQTYYDTKIGDLAEQAKKDAEAQYTSLGATMASSLTTALENGTSKADFTKGILNMFKKTAIEAAVLAAGFAEKFTAIGKMMAIAIQNGTISDVIGSFTSNIGDLFSQAKTLVSGISGVFDTASANVPAFAGGTSFAPGGIALVGERGPELITLPRGSSVMPANQTSDVLNGKGDVHINIQSTRPLDPIETAARVKMTMNELAFAGSY